MAITLKISKQVLSMLCALGALLWVAAIIPLYILLILLGVYVAFSLLADRLTPAPQAQSTGKPKRRKPNPYAPRPQNREWAFSLITGLIPMLALVLMELGLRGLGLGASYPLFMDAVGAPGYLQVNPDVIKRFLVAPSAASAMQPDTVYFLKDKPPGTFRIFVMGESSAAGFPYGRFGSLTGLLNQRLKRTFPDRNIEVVSTAMSGINSYELLEFTDEIIAQKPDAILIYTGHNEYLGVLGVGSALAVSTSRPATLAFLKLGHLRVFQLVKEIVYNLGGAFRPQTANRNLMATIAREKQIPYGSAIFQAGEAQFRSNMDDLLSKYQRAGVPVFIGTLASNERDQPPFISALAPGTDSSLWTKSYQQAVQAFDAGDLETATTALDEALRLDDTSADGYYLQGHLLEARGEYAAAQKSYLAAKDRDQLRFRAPEVFNDVIRQLAQAHGAEVVDVQAVLRKESKNGIIGKDLMLEHLHPNIRGYFLLTDAYYDALQQRGMIGAWDHSIPEDVAWEEVPLTEVDLLYAQYKVEQLLSDYPYKKTSTKPNIPEPTNEIERLANDMYNQRGSWLEHMMTLLDYYRKQEDYADSLKVALIVAEAVPFDAGYQSMAGQLLLLQNKPDQAIPYLVRAISLNPGDADMAVDLAKGYHALGRDDLARAALLQALRINPNHPEAQDLLNSLGEPTQTP